MGMIAAILLLAIHGHAPARGQDNDDGALIKRLVRQLGDESPQVRDKAQAALLDLGDKAIDALRAVPPTEDVEIRTRAKLILSLLEEARAERELVKDQRPEKLRLVSARVKDVPLDEALTTVQETRYFPFDTAQLDLTRPVTLQVRDAPIRRALAEMGLGISRTEPTAWVLIEEPAARNAVHLDGVSFRFDRRPWRVDGNLRGHVFATQVDQDFGGYLFWSVTRIMASDPVAFETCDVHSPKLVYVSQADLGESRVHIKGTRWWFYDTTVEFNNPKDGDTKRVGKYEIQVRWPKIYVRCADGIPSMVLYDTLVDEHIRLKTKVFKTYIGGTATLRIHGREAPPGEGPPTWCGCLGAPTRWKREMPLAEEHYVYPETEHGHPGSHYTIDEIEKIEIRFHKPVREPFAFSSPALK